MGIVLSVVVAFIDAFNNTFIKKGTAKFNLLTVTWAWQVFSLIILVPALLFTGVPHIGNSFLWSALLKIFIQIVALFFYTAALQKTDLSLALPMLAFTPAVTMVVSYFMNGDVPSSLGIIGVLLIMFGAYLLNITKERRNILAPFKAVFENKGVFYMFLVSVLWGVTTSLDRTAVRNSGPVFYSFFVAVIISIVLTPIALLKHKKDFFKVFTTNSLKSLIPIGILEGAVQLAQMTAVGLTLAAYVIAIKRSSIIISSILGYLVFKEKINSRILPILVMFVGILFIVLFK